MKITNASAGDLVDAILDVYPEAKCAWLGLVDDRGTLLVVTEPGEDDRVVVVDFAAVESWDEFVDAVLEALT